MDRMIAQPHGGHFCELDVDLWSVPVAELHATLDAVSVDSFLNHVFSVLLHREPDVSGAEHYRNRIRMGHSRQSVVRDVLRAAEFRERHGAKARRAQPIEDFVNQTYQDVLDRWPDEDGRLTYIRIGQKWRGRAKVERNILASPEAIRLGGGRLARIRVFQDYARAARWLRVPVIGARLRRRNEMMARLARIELRLASQPVLQHHISAPAPVVPADIIRAVPPVFEPVPAASEIAAAGQLDHPLLREARIETLDPDTASKLERDGWVFRVALRDARRKESVQSRTTRTTPAATGR